MAKSLSVIIPTLNEEDFLGHTLTCLKNQTVTPREVLVVDGGSTDKTKQVAQKYRAVTFFQCRAGTAYQRNYGAQKATGQRLLFLDADIHLEPDFIHRIMEYFDEHNLSTCCPWYLAYKSNLSTTLILGFFSCIFWTIQKILPSGAGPCILINKKLYLKLKGFNPEILHDDIHLIRRAGKIAPFSIAPVICYVSDRRFKKEGNWNVFTTYLKLGFLFLVGNYQGANRIRYDMSKDRYE